jgi:hypothetical protein
MLPENPIYLKEVRIRLLKKGYIENEIRELYNFFEKLRKI